MKGRPCSQLPSCCNRPPPPCWHQIFSTMIRFSPDQGLPQGSSAVGLTFEVVALVQVGDATHDGALLPVEGGHGRGVLAGVGGGEAGRGDLRPHKGAPRRANAVVPRRGLIATQRGRGGLVVALWGEWRGAWGKQDPS